MIKEEFIHELEKLFAFLNGMQVVSNDECARKAIHEASHSLWKIITKVKNENQN